MAELPNECWQADVTHVVVADGVVFEVLNVIDDHSRLCLASRVFVTARSPDVVRTLHRAAASYGYPESFLTDNGPEYVASAFRAHLAEKGLTHLRIPPRSRTSRSGGGRLSTAVASVRSASSRLRQTPSSPPTTAAAGTTGTTCGAALRARSSTATRPRSQHDHHQPQGPTVTSTLGLEALGQHDDGVGGSRGRAAAP